MEQQDDFITLYLDDGTELDCTILTIFEADGRDYIALLPKTPLPGRDGEVFIYRYSEDENEEPVLENIETDEEFELVDEIFDQFLDDCEYDELVEAD